MLTDENVSSVHLMLSLSSGRIRWGSGRWKRDRFADITNTKEYSNENPSNDNNGCEGD